MAVGPTRVTRFGIAAIFSLATAMGVTPTQGFIPLSDPSSVPDWFPYEVNAIEVTSPGMLRADGLGTTTELRLVPGTVFSLADTTYTVEGERPWSGLLREESGSPMAMVVWRLPGSANGARVALTDRLWVRIDDDVAVRFEWYRGENEAEQSLALALPRLDSAQWGIVEGKATQWFSSLAPGTGTVLGDGTRATLVDFVDQLEDDAAGRPAVRVRFERDAGREEDWYIGESDTPDARVVFECPASRPVVIRIGAWADGTARAGIYLGGALAKLTALDAEGAWSVPGTDHELALEQVVSNAFYVAPDKSPLREAVIRVDDRTIGVREGEAVREGDALLSYVRMDDARRIALTLRRADGTEALAAIEGNEEIVFADGARRFRMRFEPRDAGDGIQVEELLPSGRWPMPTVLLITGLVSSLAFIATWKRRARRRR